MTIHPRLGNIIEAVLDNGEHQCSQDYLTQIQRDLSSEYDLLTIDDFLQWIRNRHYLDADIIEDQTGKELTQYLFRFASSGSSDLWKRIIAHRGASYDAPENTLASTNLAWSHGARLVEVDVHLTSDHQIVVAHDEDTKRLFDCDKVISKSTLNELRALNLRGYRAFSKEKIPLLSEVLSTVPENGKLVVEIKSKDDIVPHLKEQLSKSGLGPDQIDIISFDFDAVSSSKKEMPEYRALWLLDLDYFWPSYLVFTNPKNVRDRIMKHSLDGVNVWAGKLLNQEFIDVFHDSGLSVYAWTVNDPERACELITIGVDAVTTDRPRYIFDHLLNNIKAV